MLYVSGLSGNGRYVVRDSETDESFELIKFYGGDGGKTKYFVYDKGILLEDYSKVGKLYDTSMLLGCVKLQQRWTDGEVVHLNVSPKLLIELLGYVESSEIMDFRRTDSIDVFDNHVKACDYYCVTVETDWSYHVNLLDMIMCASYYKQFSRSLEYGVLHLCFSDRDCFEVKLCGDYKRFIYKLVTLHRSEWESGVKMTDTRFLFP